MKTESEEKFEDFCNENSIHFEKIREDKCRQPDYWIFIENQKIVVEVKQIDPNKEDLKKYQEFKEKGWVVGSSEPGARVRGKIKSAAPQISSRARGKYPGVLALYNNVPLENSLDPYHIKSAMYGLDTFVFSRPFVPEDSPKLLGRKSGPKRKFTQNHNTSISAIAVIRSEGNNVCLDVYHNLHAAIPLEKRIFGGFDCEQYEISLENRFDFKSWRLVKG